MKSTRIASVLLWLLSAALGCFAENAPRTAPTLPLAPSPGEALMTKAVFRDCSPGVDPESYAAQPRTLYRLRPRWGRLEQPLDPESGEQLLIIVSEPHVWSVDRAAGVARYARDAGPSLVFRAPILPLEELSAEVPPELRHLEFGLEAEFVAAVLQRSGSPVHAGSGASLEVELGEFRIELARSAGPNRLEALRIYRAGALFREYRYSEHLQLPADMNLFAPPERVQIIEQPAAAENPDDARE
jgi:hypothetical protein